MSTDMIEDTDKDTLIIGDTLKDFGMLIPCSHIAHNDEHIPEESAWGIFELVMPCGYVSTGYLCKSGYELLSNADEAYCSSKECNQLHGRRDVHIFLLERVNT